MTQLRPSTALLLGLFLVACGDSSPPEQMLPPVDGGSATSDAGRPLADAGATDAGAADAGAADAGAADAGLWDAAPEHDAWVPVMDAGAPMPDAGMAARDAGGPTPDAGMAARDAGGPTPDAGMAARDAGAPTPDAGMGDAALPDAGAPAVDAGATWDCAWPTWRGDGDCDASNNTAACGWDGGDCCPSTCVPGEYPCTDASALTCLDPSASENGSDAGTPSRDAGAPMADAGAPMVDSGLGDGGTSPPPTYTCPDSFWGDGFCDCGCGVRDADCDSDLASECRFDVCLTGRAPHPTQSWRCVDALVDGGAPGADGGVPSTDAGLPMMDAGTPDAGSGIPAGWSCDPIFYDETGTSICNCGCGVVDPDCGGAGRGACDVNHCPSGMEPRADDPSQCQLAGPGPRAPRPGDLVINEVLVDVPDGDAGDANCDGTRHRWEDQFVEIVNVSPDRIALADLELEVDDATRHTFVSRTLEPEESIVVYGGGTPSTLAIHAWCAGNDGAVAARSILLLLQSNRVVRLVGADGEVLDRFELVRTVDESAVRTRDGDTRATVVQHSVPSANVGAFTPGRAGDGGPFDLDAVVHPPRQIHPLHGAVVGTSRPSVEIVIGRGATGASVEFCADPDCASVVETQTVTGAPGTNVVVTSSSPRATPELYWRASSSGGTSPRSSIWSMRLDDDERPETVVTEMHVDYDRDGYADFARR